MDIEGEITSKGSSVRATAAEIVADARIYFKRTDVTLDDLKASALSHAQRVLARIAENYNLSL